MYKIGSSAAVRYHEQEISRLAAGVNATEEARLLCVLCTVGCAIACWPLVVYGHLLIALGLGIVASVSLFTALLLSVFVSSLRNRLERQWRLPVDEYTKMVISDGLLGRKVTYLYE